MVKVLVLDDVLDAVKLMKRILNATGPEVVAFTEEEEALNYARTNPVDPAILDIKLKKISGVEVLEEKVAKVLAENCSYLASINLKSTLI
jgi:CheY-like chemotaxis protein